jgi:hypothetical protein
MTRDDRDSVKSNIESLGAFGALIWAEKRLARERLAPSVRRMVTLTALEAARRLRRDIVRVSRLARCHRRAS